MYSFFTDPKILIFFFFQNLQLQFLNIFLSIIYFCEHINFYKKFIRKTRTKTKKTIAILIIYIFIIYLCIFFVGNHISFVKSM